MASRLPFVVSGPRVLANKGVAVSLFVLMVFLIPAAAACIREDDLTLEQRQYQLASQLQCPVCDGQTIDESNAQVAKDMRLKVRDLLEEGKTNAEIKDYFVVRYGEVVLGAPPKGGFNTVAWVMPVFIVVGGAGIVILTVRNLRRSNRRAAAAVAVNTADLAEYLAQVDRDLGISDESVSSEAESGNLVSEGEVSS